MKGVRVPSNAVATDFAQELTKNSPLKSEHTREEEEEEEEEVRGVLGMLRLLTMHLCCTYTCSEATLRGMKQNKKPLFKNV
jgi:hypothetical protein